MLKKPPRGATHPGAAQESTPARDAAGRWLPGQSGNVAGIGGRRFAQGVSGCPERVYRPGVSGNPAGRYGQPTANASNPGGRTEDMHRVRAAVALLRRGAQITIEQAEAALEALTEIMRASADGAAVIAAANAILDIGWGKPAEAVYYHEAVAPHSPSPAEIDELLDERARLRAELTDGEAAQSVDQARPVGDGDGAPGDVVGADEGAVDEKSGGDR